MDKSETYTTNQVGGCLIFIGMIICAVGIMTMCGILPCQKELCCYCGDDNLVATLSLLVTILIGWNIYSAISLKNEWKEFKDSEIEREKEFKETEIKKRSELREELENLKKDFSKLEEKYGKFIYFGYAITDFCQVYIKLKTNDDENFKTYAKILNALRNFLKTNEDLNWYAPACIDNMQEALKKAHEKDEKCSPEVEKDILEYLGEIRQCQLQNFDKYWNQINNIEINRKKSKTGFK